MKMFLKYLAAVVLLYSITSSAVVTAHYVLDWTGSHDWAFALAFWHWVFAFGILSNVIDGSIDLRN